MINGLLTVLYNTFIHSYTGDRDYICSLGAVTIHTYTHTPLVMFSGPLGVVLSKSTSKHLETLTARIKPPISGQPLYLLSHDHQEMS